MGTAFRVWGAVSCCGCCNRTVIRKIVTTYSVVKMQECECWLSIRVGGRGRQRCLRRRPTAANLCVVLVQAIMAMLLAMVPNVVGTKNTLGARITVNLLRPG